MSSNFKLLSISGKSKGLNIFKSSAYKEHEQTPMALIFWKMRWSSLVFIICFLAFGLSFVAEHVWRYGFNPATHHWIKLYLNNMISSFGLSIIAETPYWIFRTLFVTDIACIMPFIPLCIYFLLSDKSLINTFNPYGNDKYDSKSAKKASKKDIEKMKLLNGFMIVLGYFKSEPLMLNECLSVLCLAPPGTGKTQAIVLPTIFESNTVSMIINDPKPELSKLSSAYRATIGPVFIMNWAGVDNPEKGIYYPSWNPLSPEHVPYEEAQRELYVDSICKILVPDPEGSADPHWTNSARMALSGFVSFILSKIEKAKANDYFYQRLKYKTFDSTDANILNHYYMTMFEENSNAYAASEMIHKNELDITNYVQVGTWDNIPIAWKGKEASFSLLLDWLTLSQIKAQEITDEQRRNGEIINDSDPMKDILDEMIREATQFGYAKRAIQEISKLSSTPSGERGSILSSMITNLGVFKNSAVKTRTSHSDFHFKDLRGLKDPKDGIIKPVSVYLSINMVDAKALNPITAVFIDLMSDYLLANPPDAISPDGDKLGPMSVLFLLDEMPKMQKLDSVIKGPDLGRGQKISYLLIGQDINQIAEKYGQYQAETIISTTAAKIILRQNSYETAEKFSRMIGEEIKIKTDKEGNESKESKLLYPPDSITNLDPKKEIILFQGYYNRPIEADLTMAWQDDRLASYMKMGECSPLPEFLIPIHHKRMGYKGIPKFYNPNTKEIKELKPLE